MKGKYSIKEVDCHERGLWVTDVIKDKDNGIELPQSTVCDILNNLTEENQELKHKIKRLQTKLLIIGKISKGER